MSGYFFFNGSPSTSWHLALEIPAQVAFVAWMDEWLLRRNPHFGLALGIVTMFIIPLEYAFGVWANGNMAFFSLVKAYSLNIPLIIITCWRLSHLREDCAEGSARAKQRDKVLKHMPVSVLGWIERKFKNSNQLIARLCAAILAMNIVEACVTEILLPKSRDGNNDWSAILNALAGVLLIVSMPIPSSRWRLWYKIELNQFSDMIWDFRMTDALAPANDYWSKVALFRGWVLCYTLWNYEFAMRFTKHKGLIGAIFHLFMPFFRTYIPDSKSTNANDSNTALGTVDSSPLRYIQVRMHMLWTTICYLNLWRFQLYRIGLVQLWSGNVLLAFSLLSLLCGVVYAYLWLFRFLPAFGSEKVPVKEDVDDSQI